ncbi:helix-turn-helix transcriptional regulator [Sphingobacterium hungaricum]
MYKLLNSDFSKLVDRKFEGKLASDETKGYSPNLYSCTSTSLRSRDYDILKFSGLFEEDILVQNFKENSHISMHFQIAGKSNASISGIANDLPIKQGYFYIINCVNPTSSFLFPKQETYKYLCIALEPSFFRNVLDECEYDSPRLSKQHVEKNSFSLFDSALRTNYNQTTVLHQLMESPIADNLRVAYIRCKVKELLILSLNAENLTQKQGINRIDNSDRDKLIAVEVYLSKNYLSSLTLAGISRNFSLNEFKLKKGFKDLFGITVFGYIHELRMRHAETLLLAGGSSIS